MRRPDARFLWLALGVAGLAGALSQIDFRPPPPVVFELRVTPPAYTGKPPVLLSLANADIAAQPLRTVKIPEGSTAVLQFSGGRGVPALRFNERVVTAEAGDIGRYDARMTIGQSGRLRLEQGDRELAVWALAVTADRPPTVHFMAPVRADARRRLRIDFQAEDDFGVRAVKLRLTRPELAGDPAAGRIIKLMTPDGGRKKLAEVLVRDLTADPWAGLVVMGTLIATDAKGQSAASERQRFVLPARLFTDPTARALTGVRRLLVDNSRGRFTAVQRLHDLTARPELLGGDLRVYLELRDAYWRLRHDTRPDALGEVSQLLWHTALKLEDGGVSLAEADLRDAVAGLKQALAQDAPRRDIDARTEGVGQALQAFLSVLAQQANSRMTRGVAPLSAARFASLLRLLQRFGAPGDAAVRRADLRALETVLNALAEAAPGMGGGPMSDAEQALAALTGLIAAQQGLLDDTFQRIRTLDFKGEGRSRGQSLSARQQRLHDTLNALFGVADNAFSDFLGQAEAAMVRAGDAFSRDRLPAAAKNQLVALEAMRGGARHLAKIIHQRRRDASRNDRPSP
jgi:hypothetical protein